MKEIQVTEMVTVTKYQARDGQIFRSKNACIDYEKRLDGTRKTCEYCNGKGYLSLGYHSVRNELTCQFEQVEYTETCQKCNGKGYLEKKTVWE